MDTLDEGVRGTDNCPICGRTMEKSNTIVCGVRFIKLSCTHSVTHHTQIILRPAKTDEE